MFLNYCRERESPRSGACPDCGRQFRKGFGKGGRNDGSVVRPNEGIAL